MHPERKQALRILDDLRGMSELFTPMWRVLDRAMTRITNAGLPSMAKTVVEMDVLDVPPLFVWQHKEPPVKRAVYVDPKDGEWRIVIDGKAYTLSEIEERMTGCVVDMKDHLRVSLEGKEYDRAGFRYLKPSASFTAIMGSNDGKSWFRLNRVSDADKA